MAWRLAGSEGGVIAGDEGGLWRRGPEDLLVLIEGFIHGVLEQAHRRHARVEPFGVADGPKLDVTRFEPAQADSLGTEPAGQPVAEGEGRRKKPLLLVHVA